MTTAWSGEKSSGSNSRFRSPVIDVFRTKLGLHRRGGRQLRLDEGVVDVAILLVVLPKAVGVVVELTDAERQPVPDARDRRPRRRARSCCQTHRCTCTARRFRLNSGLNSLNAGSSGPAFSRMNRSVSASARRHRRDAQRLQELRLKQLAHASDFVARQRRVGVGQETGGPSSRPGRPRPTSTPPPARAARSRGRDRCARGSRCGPPGPDRAGTASDTPRGCR